jgi:hypothetical protein
MGDQDSAEASWLVIFTGLKQRDETMMKDYREELDTLLVFVSSFELIGRRITSA